MFVPPRDFDSPSSVAWPAPLRRFGRRAGLGSGQPSPGKSASDEAILPPSGSAVRRRRDSPGAARSAHRFCRARGNADTRMPSRPSYCRPRPSPDGDHALPGRHCMPLARGANFSEILLERYNHPPSRRSRIIPDQLKMTNSPPTCKIAIFRRPSAAAETADTQSEQFRARRVTSIDGISPTSPCRPDRQTP